MVADKADFIYLRKGDKDFGIGVTTNKTYNIYTYTTSSCFGSTPNEYKGKIDALHTVKVQNENLKFRNMSTGWFNTYYYRVSDPANSYADSHIGGPLFDLKVKLEPDFQHYITLVATHKGQQPWSIEENDLELTEAMQEIDTISTEDHPTAVIPRRSDRIKIYPNPFNNELTVQHSFNQPISLQVITLEGKIVANYNITRPIEKIDTKRLVSGLYLIKVYDDSRVISIFKFLKL